MLAGSLLLATAAFAQVQSGKITYEETVKMDVQLEGDAVRFADMLPKEQHFRKVLYFGPEASLYLPETEKKKAEEETAAADGNVRMRIRMDVPQDKIYTDLKNARTVEQRDFMGRKFLVSGETTKGAWKLTGRQKAVLEYPCQEAVRINEKDTVTAWFTTGIPVSSGPAGWTGLPGMILEADLNGRLLIRAVTVAPGDVEGKLLVQPKEGKKVSKQEYKAIVDAKRKEMQEQFGGNGNVIIRVQNN